MVAVVNGELKLSDGVLQHIRWLKKQGGSPTAETFPIGSQFNGVDTLFHMLQTTGNGSCDWEEEYAL
ncbi:hypothetical protein B0H11DRAFT_2215735 [Mycena galericulata]|nr:hypothetical protein B0H11DRAFT_2215735 [Mycena galericulata]